MSAFGRLADLPLQRVWDGIEGRVVHGEQLTLGVLEVAPGNPLPEHHHANEQVGLVVRGELQLTVGGETRALGPGETYTIAPGVPHSGRGGPQGALVLDIFAPARAEWRELETLPPTPPAWP
jgi:quercetin dioxygenase-like cupin family protein